MHDHHHNLPNLTGACQPWRPHLQLETNPRWSRAFFAWQQYQNGRFMAFVITCICIQYSHMEVSTNGTPNGWFVMENPTKMGWFGTTILGKQHILLICPHDISPFYLHYLFKPIQQQGLLLHGRVMEGVYLPRIACILPRWEGCFLNENRFFYDSNGVFCDGRCFLRR